MTTAIAVTHENINKYWGISKITLQHSWGKEGVCTDVICTGGHYYMVTSPQLLNRKNRDSETSFHLRFLA
jgi:hypothetical protein